jgi:urease subunit beta
MVPGEITGPDGTLTLNVGLRADRITVLNTGDRPVQVGSHFHLAEANEALQLDRSAARGMRLDIAAGTSVRFEPGIGQTVGIVAYGGDRIVAGFRGLVGGPLDQPGAGSNG